MPELAVSDLRVLVRVDDEHLGVPFHVRRGGMDVQGAEPFAERDVLLRGHRYLLVAEEDDRVAVKRVAHFAPLVVRQRVVVRSAPRISAPIAGEHGVTRSFDSPWGLV